MLREEMPYEIARRRYRQDRNHQYHFAVVLTASGRGEEEFCPRIIHYVAFAGQRCDGHLPVND